MRMSAHKHHCGFCALIAWRRRTLGDGHWARLALPDDVTGVVFRAACVLAIVIAAVREIAIGS